MLFQMKRSTLVPILSLAVMLAAGGALVYASNTAKPGDPLYTLDRTSEAVMLSVKKTVSKISYGKYNLSLASERMQEMKDLKKNTVAAIPFVKIVSAQTTELQKLNEYIALLLADISKNLAEAQSIFEGLPAAQREEFSMEIADKTTEYGNDLMEIAKDLSNENLKKLSELITDIEVIDSSAVGFLTNLPDSDPENESEQENHISTTLQDKLETKLLRLREALRIYSERKVTNIAKLSAENITKAEALIAEITLDLGTAEIQLGVPDYKAVGDILDSTADKIDKLKDLVKVDGDEDAGNNSGNDSSTDSGDDDGEDSEDEDDDSNGTGTPRPSRTPEVEDEDEDEDESEPSSTPRASSTPKPSETPEPSEAPEEEEEEDVDGTQTQPSSNFSILRNRLRF